MKHRVVIACVLAAAVAVFGFRQAADQSTPEGTVKAFAAAIQAVDFKAAAKLVKGGKPDQDYSQFTKGFESRKFKLDVLDLKADVQGEKAKATYKLHVDMGNGQNVPDQPDSVQLERVAGVWLIVPATQAEGNAPFSAFAAMLSNPVQVMAQARKSAESAVCLSNVKQICLACIMYANDFDDTYKFKTANWKKSIYPYCKTETIFHCPDDKSGAVSYSFNPYLIGKKETAIARPAETVMVYEGSKMKLTFRHNGKATVGFADGHVKQLSAAQVKTLIWKP